MKNNINSKKKKILKTSIVCLLILGIMTTNIMVFAAEEDPLQVVNNLSNFIFGLIRAVGMIILGFSVTQPTSGSYLFHWGFWNKGNRYIHLTY